MVKKSSLPPSSFSLIIVLVATHYFVCTISTLAMTEPRPRLPARCRMARHGRNIMVNPSSSAFPSSGPFRQFHRPQTTTPPSLATDCNCHIIRQNSDLSNYTAGRDIHMYGDIWPVNRYDDCVSGTDRKQSNTVRPPFSNVDIIVNVRVNDGELSSWIGPVGPVRDYILLTTVLLV